MPVTQLRFERVIIYCLTCGRNTSAASYVIEGLFGYLPYGLLTGRLHCKKGCGDRFGVILPIDAPTPRAWVERYGMPPRPEPKRERLPMPVEEDLPGKLVEIGKGGTFLKIHARAEDPAILHWGFDYFLGKVHTGDTPPHLAVTRGAQWSRDSRRDYKVVAKWPKPDGPPSDGGQDKT